MTRPKKILAACALALALAGAGSSAFALGSAETIEIADRHTQSPDYAQAGTEDRHAGIGTQDRHMP